MFIFCQLFDPCTVQQIFLLYGPPDKEGNSLLRQIQQQDQQRYQSRALQEGLALQLGNQQGQGHGTEIHQERHRGNGDHGIDKIIAVHLHNGGPGAGNVHIQQHPQAADSQTACHILQIGIELGKAVVGQQLGGREEVDDIHQHQNNDGGI